MTPSMIERVDRLFAEGDRPETPGAALAIVKDGAAADFASIARRHGILDRDAAFGKAAEVVASRASRVGPRQRDAPFPVLARRELPTA